MVQLAQIARYFPFASGRYEVKAGFSPLHKDFGNGRVDALILQIDRGFHAYRDEKLAARAERLSKYYLTHELPDTHLHYVCDYLARLMAKEHAEHFSLTGEPQGQCLFCRLSGDRLWFDNDFRLVRVDYGQPVDPPYIDGLDAIACQLQEDLALVNLQNETNCISALHLCFPNHWAAQDKIGKDFISAHAPVPGMAALNRSAQNLLQTMLAKGPFVRFAWGIGTDRRLNHHPEAPTGHDPESWRGRSLDDEKAAVFIRSERQTLTGLADINCCLFTIHTYFEDVRQLAGDTGLMSALIAALQSMPRDSAHYKGLAPCYDGLLAKLSAWRDAADSGS